MMLAPDQFICQILILALGTIITSNFLPMKIFRNYLRGTATLMTEMKTKKQKKKLELNSFYAIKAGYENNSALVREKPYTDKWLNNKLNYTFKKDIEKRQAIANQERQILENIEKIKIERDTPAREVIEQFREYNERSYLIKSLYKNEDMNTGSIDYNDTLSTIKTKYNCVKKKTMSKDF